MLRLSGLGHPPGDNRMGLTLSFIPLFFGVPASTPLSVVPLAIVPTKAVSTQAVSTQAALNSTPPEANSNPTFSLPPTPSLSNRISQAIPPGLEQIPNPTLPRSPSLPLPIPQPSPTLPLDVAPTAPAADPKLPDTIPGSITVARFEFEGNTALSSAELATVTAPFTQRSLSFAELLQVETAIAQRYSEAGFINSGAVIEANQVLNPQAAVVKVRIIEGSLEEIRVTGTRRLNPNYVRSRLKLAATRPLNQKRILKALQVLQLDPLLKAIVADLSGGSRPELAVLTVNVTEADPFDVELFADNSRTPSVGSFQRGLSITHRNVLGYGDRLALDYANSSGSNAFDLSYTVPLNARNGTLTVAGGVSETRIIEQPFDRLDIKGRSYTVSLGYRQPVVQTPTQEVAVGLTVARQESQTELFGVNFPLSPGADKDGTTRTFAVRLFQDWTQRSARSVFAGRSHFSFGVGAFDATLNAAPPDSRFFNWRMQTQYVRLLAPQTLLVLRSDLQLSPTALIPTEQFALGGQHSVRGYRQDALLTDNGFFASAEVRIPLLRVNRVKGVLQIAPFVDFGAGWNSGGTLNPERSLLLGAGVGLQWQMGDRLTTRFDWGIPLLNSDSSRPTLQEQGLYFSIRYLLF
ncbi:MAG: BamA/TamA family outer membrane protein [Thermosynechococcaceae cyanobacterium MS004]|nr:BamA/TamA family outer membrane protein [Thermosynechococcaceae cyanobacterium MS004]